MARLKRQSYRRRSSLSKYESALEAALKEKDVYTVASSAATGTVAIAGDATLVGTGTAFLTELSVGDKVEVAGEVREIASIANDSNATVTSAFAGTAPTETLTIADVISRVPDLLLGAGVVVIDIPAKDPQAMSRLVDVKVGIEISVKDSDVSAATAEQIYIADASASTTPVVVK
jgi:hypothetical protein